MQVHFEGPLLYVSLAGEMNGPLAEQTYRRVVREFVDGGCFKLLIDGRGLSGELTTTARYSLGKVVAEENASLVGKTGRQVQVAMVGTDPLLDRDRFGETVARNRGAVVKVTHDLESAYRWLGVDPPPDAPAE